MKPDTKVGVIVAPGVNARPAVVAFARSLAEALERIPDDWEDRSCCFNTLVGTALAQAQDAGVTKADFLAWLGDRWDQYAEFAAELGVGTEEAKN